ncbi:MAG: NnrS family protein [Sphingobacteriia bacterium]|nr:NnrS family protein [Sphingobacteriia bacterium]NCC39308.1 NnrS family protein [Gammaproteobacteria bacterium]
MQQSHRSGARGPARSDAEGAGASRRGQSKRSGHEGSGEPRTRGAGRSGLGSLPVLALGFRPFFLLAGISAILMILLWLGMLAGQVPPPAHLAGPGWHAHSLLYGYLSAVIAGFLLTAVRNWTNIDTPTGLRLGALAALWIAARGAPWVPAPVWLIIGLDLSFYPALAAALWRPLWSGPNPVNRVFLGLFGGMTLAALMVHLDALGLLDGAGPRGHRLMLDLTLLAVLLISGRVMPFFIERGIASARPRVIPWAERLSLALGGALLVADLAQPMGRLAGGLAIGLGVVQLIRLAGWHHPRIWTTPMLTVLYCGLLWLACGLILDGLPAFSALPPRGALHTLTVGAIGVLTLGMMARVAVGHTGRPMRAAPLTLLAFVLINLAAAVRGLVLISAPGHYQDALMISGWCWIGAFGLFLWVHGPMLLRPRPDGRPG